MPASEMRLNIKKNKIGSVTQFLLKDYKRNKWIYLMALPILAYYIIFSYIPMYGATIAFKDFSPRLGVLGSKWIGLVHFKSFFSSYYFFQVVKNTLLISIYEILWGFPAPIIFALLINEVKNKFFKSTIQTFTYVPNFISLVVVCGLIMNFTATDGIINQIIAFFGGNVSNLIARPEMFRTIYVASGIWQSVGWGSIIYLAALSNIDSQLYEAAYMDGAGRFRQMIHVTIPGIAPTIVILLILRMGSLLAVGYEKIILLYSPLTYETADVISSFVYRKGITDANYSYATAVGLFNSVINFVMLILTNSVSRRFSETSLW